MKTYIYLLLFIFSSYGNLFSQSLFNWNHYYAPTTISYDAGNYIAQAGIEEIIKFDKSTYSFTRIPYPDDIRYINLHNYSYTLAGGGVTCKPSLFTGPANTSILKGCANNYYQFDGYNWLPFTSYLGFNPADIDFMDYQGGSVFFVSNADQKLYKYNGGGLVAYDTANSPYRYYMQVKLAHNDDILLSTSDHLNIFHNGSWSNYDTTFFNTSQLNAQYDNIAVNQNNDFTFCDCFSNKLWTYHNQSGTWSNVSIPSAMYHGGSSFHFIFTLRYDDNGHLLIAGDSTFCKYDGAQFTDYYTLPLGTLDTLGYLHIMHQLTNNTFILTDGYEHQILFNTNSGQTSPMPADPHALLPGNQLLPSLKDNSGNLWFGSIEYGSGLMKYDGNWHVTDLYSHNISGSILSLTKDTGNSIVIGYGESSSEGPVRMNDTNFVFLNDNLASYNHVVQDLAIDLNHHYWFGGSGSGVPQGLAEYFSGNINYYTNPLGQSVYAIAIDSLNNKWVSYTSTNASAVTNFNGVFKFDGVYWTHFDKSNSPLPNDTVVKIIREPQTNAIWFCTSNGFAKYHNGVWSLLNTGNSPIPGNNAENIYFADDGSKWFSTQEGFASLHGSVWEVYTVYNSELHNSDIESIVIGNDCTVWLTTEFGLSSAFQSCGVPQGKLVNGTVSLSSNLPAVHALVNVSKLNGTGTDVTQVENVYTNNAGHFTYFTKDTGTYYFQAVATQTQFPGQITTYSDSAKVIQQASSLHLTSNGTYNTTLHFSKAMTLSGTCSFKGKLVSYNLSQRVGSVRVVLMKNNQAVVSELTDMYGRFEFSNIVAGGYTLWVDKLGLDNNLSPLITIDCMHGNDEYSFELFAHQVVAIPLSVTNTDMDNHISVYPNPFDNKIVLSSKMTESSRATLSIYDIKGDIVKQATFYLEMGFNHMEINTSDIKKGIYVYKLVMDHQTLTGKLVK